jgi:hypothetical protein
MSRKAPGAARPIARTRDWIGMGPDADHERDPAVGVASFEAQRLTSPE